MKKLFISNIILLLLSCDNRICIKPQVCNCAIIEKHNDTIIIKYNEYPDTLVMKNGSMYYDTNGILSLSILNDTVIYTKDNRLANVRITAIRKEDNQDVYRSSKYLYTPNGDLKLRKQILYNKNFEILGVKVIQSIEYNK